MIVVNLTKNTTLSTDLKIVHSIFDKSLGLLKKSNPRSLLFKTRFGIHTFLMKEPIDILVLDKSFKAVRIKTSLKTNQLFFWNIKYNLVLELPNHTLTKTKTKIGDRIKIT